MLYPGSVASGARQGLIRTAIDTSLLVAALLPWHKSHGVAFGALEVILTEEGGFVLPLPSLVESYSVLTRMPAPHRLRPEDAYSTLATLLLDTARIVGLDGGDTWRLLMGSVEIQIAGGAIYDAQILACAQKAGAERIFTLNPRHFERLRSEGVRVEIPT
jgi:predicted nucleic acid-binding protein